MSKVIMDDPDKLKFTKIRRYRINFKYDGVQYSLNEFEDGWEQYTALVERDSKEHLSSDYGCMCIYDYIGRHMASSRNIVYSHIDKSEFLKSLATYGFIEKTEEHKREDKQKRKAYLLMSIEEKKREIKEMELELKRLEDELNE